MSKVYTERKYNIEQTDKWKITLSNDEENIVLDFYYPKIDSFDIDDFSKILDITKYCINTLKQRISARDNRKIYISYHSFRVCRDVVIIKKHDHFIFPSRNPIEVARITHEDCLELLDLMYNMEKNAINELM